MPSWQGKSKTTPLGYRIFVVTLKHLGVGPAYVLLRVVSFYYFVFSLKSSKPVYAFFRKRLGYGRARSLAYLYRDYFFFGQAIVDRVVLRAGIPNRFTFDFEGEENLRQMVSLRTGGLLLSAHIGNWEIAGHLLSRLGTKINIVMFDEEHEKVKQYLDTVTGQRAMHVITIKKGMSHIYEISEALKNNELVCMHADRFLDDRKTLTQEFLGAPARFPMGPFALAMQFRVPVSFTFAMKTSRLHYHLSATRPQTYGSPSKMDTMKKILGDFAAEMEKKVSLYPEQWYNYYDFWKT